MLKYLALAVAALTGSTFAAAAEAHPRTFVTVRVAAPAHYVTPVRYVTPAYRYGPRVVYYRVYRPRHQRHW
jgi:hypothetical protein